VQIGYFDPPLEKFAFVSRGPKLWGAGDTESKSDITRSIKGSQLFMKKRKKNTDNTDSHLLSVSDKSDFSDNASDM